MRTLALVLALCAPLTLSACQTASYALQERLLDKEKRDILVERVEDVAREQGEAKEEFADALEAFRAVVAVNGGELERNYDQLKRAYDRADGQADDVRARVAQVKRVSRDLFREWNRELADYSDPALRRSSERQLRDTEARFAELSAAMDDAVASMDPVLSVFSDRVLYLKHNLNARAIAALDGETASLEGDVARLIAEMEASIAAADSFIREMGGSA